MHLKRAVLLALAATAMTASTSHAALFSEHVTGGVLDLTWVPGFSTPNTMNAAVLTPADPAYANPSGDHTVGVVINAAPDSGGIVLTAIDPGAVSDYTWEADIFTGAGNTRRGLVVRADPSNQFQSCYQFVVQSGLLQFNFRKLVASTPTTLGSWFSNSFPGGTPQANTWHHMKVIALGNTFRCFWDGYELTTSPIVDSDIASGWAGVYNFRFDLGGVPVYFDDIELTPTGGTPVTVTSWGHVKASYR